MVGEMIVQFGAVSVFWEVCVDQEPDFPPFEAKSSQNANEKCKNRFFSQEMASSSSHNNNSIPLATLLEWYKIRDTFIGNNFVDQNIPLSLLRLVSILTLVGSRRFALERTLTLRKTRKEFFLLLAKTTLMRCVSCGVVVMKMKLKTWLRCAAQLSSVSL